MDEAIDRWAQLCSSALTHFEHTFQIGSHPWSECHILQFFFKHYCVLSLLFCPTFAPIKTKLITDVFCKPVSIFCSKLTNLMWKSPLWGCYLVQVCLYAPFTLVSRCLVSIHILFSTFMVLALDPLWCDSVTGGIKAHFCKKKNMSLYDAVKTTTTDRNPAGNGRSDRTLITISKRQHVTQIGVRLILWLPLVDLCCNWLSSRCYLQIFLLQSDFNCGFSYYKHILFFSLNN